MHAVQGTTAVLLVLCTVQHAFYAPYYRRSHATQDTTASNSTSSTACVLVQGTTAVLLVLCTVLHAFYAPYYRRTHAVLLVIVLAVLHPY